MVWRIVVERHVVWIPVYVYRRENDMCSTRGVRNEGQERYIFAVVMVRLEVANHSGIEPW